MLRKVTLVLKYFFVINKIKSRLTNPITPITQEKLKKKNLILQDSTFVLRIDASEWILLPFIVMNVSIAESCYTVKAFLL